MKEFRTRRLLFKSAQRYSGGAAKKLAASMSGYTGAVCDIRLPPFGARGMSVDGKSWPARFVEFAHHQLQPVSLFRTFDPFGLELAPGHYYAAVLRRDRHLVQSIPFEVRRGSITLVSIYPPVNALIPGKLVRRFGGSEVTFILPG
jgi:hypothetical protein